MRSEVTCPSCKANLDDDYLSHLDFACPSCHIELKSNGPFLVAIALFGSLPLTIWLYSLIPESIPMIVGFLPLELFVLLVFAVPILRFLRVTPAQ